MIQSLPITRTSNTHKAYRKLRQVRLDLRTQNEPLTTKALIPTLSRYSELGKQYLKILRSVFRSDYIQLALCGSNRMQVIGAPVYWKRLLALIYDGLVVTALILISGLVSSVIAQGEAPASLTQLLIVLAVGGYFWWSWSRGGQTAGMRA